MSFTGNEGAFISLSEAAVLTSNYRNSGQPNPILGQFLGAEKLQDLLKQTDCVGLRIYYGKNAQGKPTIVVVGVDRNEDDILTEEPLILDQSMPCPPTCGHSNELNS
jgi:hypothetical protein